MKEDHDQNKGLMRDRLNTFPSWIPLFTPMNSGIQDTTTQTGISLTVLLLMEPPPVVDSKPESLPGFSPHSLCVRGQHVLLSQKVIV